MLFDKNSRETNLTSSQKRGLAPTKPSSRSGGSTSGDTSPKPTTPKPTTPTTPATPTTPTTPTTPIVNPPVIPASRKWSDIVAAYFPPPLPQTMKAGGLVRGNGCAKRGRGKGTMR